MARHVAYENPKHTHPTIKYTRVPILEKIGPLPAQAKKNWPDPGLLNAIIAFKHCHIQGDFCQGANHDMLFVIIIIIFLQKFIKVQTFS